MLTDARRTATLLGALGVLPFATLAMLVALGDDGLRDRSAFALAAYGAGIVSFLGAVHWGLAIARTDHAKTGAVLIAGVVPQLAAWLALLLPTRLALFALGVFVLATLALDAVAVRIELAPKWWLPLRTWLSLAAGASLGLGGVFAR